MATTCGRCCVTYLFFSYMSGTMIYLILAIFAKTGNIALLVENLHQKQVNNTLIITDEERNAVKNRTTYQYIMAFAFSLALTLILYFSGMRRKKAKTSEINRHKSLDLEYKPDIIYQPENEINTNTNILPIELGQGNNDAIIKNINSVSSIGMLENET